MEYLTVFIPLMPLIAAGIIGFGHLFDWINGEKDERFTARLASIAVFLSCVMSSILLGADLLGHNQQTFTTMSWLESGQFEIDISFIATGFNAALAALFSILLWIVTRFSINYLHREAGFHRFFFILSLFSSAMLLLILSNNAAMTFIGWEIAGLSSYLLIGYAYDRPVATFNATRVFVTNRIGDAGFILGIGLAFYHLNTLNWVTLNTTVMALSTSTAAIIALCFIVAAFAKSVQLPFTPWLARAMEGPTPSSAVFYGAVMVHAGVFLVILIQPIIERSQLVMGLLIVVGLATAIYSFIVGLTQTDIKSALSFSISGQLGLMFLECGLGFWELAMWHLCAHAVVRCYQVLTAPSFMHNVIGNPVKPVYQKIAGLRWLYVASLQRFWLDPIANAVLVKPAQGLGRDLVFFDKHILSSALGAPASSERAISSLIQLEQKVLAQKPETEANDFGQGNNKGIAKIFEWIADVMSWFEERLVLKGIGEDVVDLGRKLGRKANNLEKLLLKPRYPTLFGLIVLLIAASL